MTVRRILLLCLGLCALVQTSRAQRYTFFSPEVRTEYPSVVYDFLETYLYDIAAQQSRGDDVTQRLQDDKVVFITGTPSSARSITPDMAFRISTVEDKYYEVAWRDAAGDVVLQLAFPMQYELLLGKPKVEIEKEFRATLAEERPFTPFVPEADGLEAADGCCWVTTPADYYHVESLTDCMYFMPSAAADAFTPLYTADDRWRSAANLFLGAIADIDNYRLYIEQNVYGFNKLRYTVTLRQWLAYCQAMQLHLYFGVEEERVDGLKALLIARSADLGFNHMLSLIIPDDFVTNRKAVLKATLNAYIPTQNVKDLYQQYIDKPKKQI